MSLINQALKRAQEAQTAQAQNPHAPQPTLHFRPAETAPRARHALGFMLPIGWTLVALLLLFVIWQAIQKDGSPQIAARAPQLTASANPSGSQSGQLPATPAPQTAPRVEPAAPAAAEPATASVTDEPAPASVTPAVIPQAPPPPPKPAPPKLQGIVWNPRRPSALISGKTLFIGDKFGDLKVSTIDQESATLVGGGQTNVLTLEQ